MTHTLKKHNPAVGSASCDSASQAIRGFAERAVRASGEHTFVYGARVWFLQRRDSPEWWAAVAEHSHSAPGLIRELLRGPSVVCERSEAMQALAWAKAHPAWRDDRPALEAVDTLRHPQA